MKYTIKTNPQGSEEWLQDRLGHFTGSDAQAVANNGAGLTTCVFEKVAEILTGKSKEAYTNLDMERGKELEALGRNAYEIESGITVLQTGFLEINEHIGASVDGFIGEDGIFELKCPNDANFVRYIYERKIQPVYEWQVQHYLHVSDRKWCDFVTYNPNFLNPLLIQRVERDEKEISLLQAGLKKGIELKLEILKKVK